MKELKYKYKIGDVVKITGTNHSFGVPDDVIGKKGKILKTDSSSLPYKIHLIDYSEIDEKNELQYYYWLNESDIELFRHKKITPETLKKLSLGSIIITSENEHNRYVKNDYDEFQNDCCDTLFAGELTEELIFSQTSGNPRLIEIHEPVYYTTYNVNDEPIEMTIEEISEKLGYNIKIVKSK